MTKKNIICVGCESGRTASTKVEKISTYDYKVKSTSYYGGTAATAIKDIMPMVNVEEKGAFRLHYYVVYVRCTDNTWMEFTTV